ncbi:hypothetical protein [Halobellus captivus]|uniref:hypothetical protein n=1 Tax=Halobellus captivus TaxID=2592614 RepID=UPI0011AADD54|nr:hypothetical protein [Halobellus captivus]
MTAEDDGHDSDEKPDNGAESYRDSETQREAEAPLSELARDVTARRTPRSESESKRGDTPQETGGNGDPFEEMSAPEIDTEALWESLAGEDDAETQAPGELAPDAATPLDGEAETGAREHVVEKEAFCQKCPHFADPPEFGCTHEGTEIVEVVDSEHFRVRNCPIVDE